MQKKKQKKYRLFLLLIFSICFIQLFSIIFTYCSTGQESFNRRGIIKYEEVMIHKGDSLWVLAKQYKPSHHSTKEYLNNIKDFNQIKSNRLYAGDTIIMPIYYSEN